MGSWYGKRQEISAYWLRWWDREGNLLLWGSELIAFERQRNQQLTQKLRNLGSDPDADERV